MSEWRIICKPNSFEEWKELKQRMYDMGHKVYFDDLMYREDELTYEMYPKLMAEWYGDKTQGYWDIQGTWAGETMSVSEWCSRLSVNPLKPMTHINKYKFV